MLSAERREVLRPLPPAAAAALTALFALECAGPAAPAPRLALERVASGLRAPLQVVAPAHDRRLFIVEQAGSVRVVRDRRLLDHPFLDLRARVSFGGERGLLSLAFHPRYASNGRLFVNYTDRKGDTRIEEYRVSQDPDRVDPGSARLILTIDQPYANHNGGHILFGPDGMLYIGMGDGGSGGDPHGNGQNRRALLGKILRIDVDRSAPYAIPTDNPFVGRTDTRGEIWALGARNPWRMAFDEAGHLWIADVGQNQYEEVHVLAPGRGGANLGWNLMEGTHAFRRSPFESDSMDRPVLEYSHRDGCSITGGYVYRGRALAGLRGTYFYADYCSGWVKSFRLERGAAIDRRSWPELTLAGNITSFGEDAAGELYLTEESGQVHRIVPGK